LIRLSRVQSKRFELSAPFGGRIAKPLDPDTAGQATFDSRPYQIGREECE
jgi:hypothetical protein